jgi:thioredoxin 1
MQNNWQVTVGIMLLMMAAGWSVGDGPTACNAPADTTSKPIPEPKEEREEDMSTQIPTRNGVEHANDADFGQLVLNADVPVLVDFYADWCGPCRMIAPVLDDLASELTDAKIVKVNVDRNPGLAAQYRISSIPSLLVFKDGEVVRRHVGLADKAQLKSLIEL